MKSLFIFSQDNRPIIFRWELVEQASEYNFQLSPVKDFSEIYESSTTQNNFLTLDTKKNSSLTALLACSISAS